MKLAGLGLARPFSDSQGTSQVCGPTDPAGRVVALSWPWDQPQHSYLASILAFMDDPRHAHLAPGPALSKTMNQSPRSPPACCPHCPCTACMAAPRLPYP